MKKIIFSIVPASVFLIILFFGRSIYMPVMVKIKGKQTVQSVTERIEADVLKRLQSEFSILDLESYPVELILVGLKEEQRLEVYAKSNNGIKLLKKYPFTAYSGHLGPKLKEGDHQIPEGIYRIEYLNPNSSYYLSIKINYPNKFDKSKSILSSATEMGNNIFIHGKAASVGCIPIGDEAIEEVFLLVSKASKGKIKVIISPRDFRTNPEYPSIPNIDWEGELYQIISSELEKIII